MHQFWRVSILLVGIVLLVVTALDAPVSGQMVVMGEEYGLVTRESVSSDGNEGNGWSTGGNVSDDGQWVAFSSVATNLVAGDTNGYHDIFLRNRTQGSTTLISIAHTGGQADGESYALGISADGAWVLYRSEASNIVADDTNDAEDLFLWERATGITRRVSVSSTGTEGSGTGWVAGAALSADGRYSVFATNLSGLVPNDTNNAADVFVHDRVTGVTERVSVSSGGTQGNDSSYYPGISANGRYVVFQSDASNLVPNDTNEVSDIFVHDRETGMVERVSRRINGEQSAAAARYPMISGDGRLVAYSTNEDLATGASTFIDTLYWYDRISGMTTLAVQGAGGARIFALSPDFTNDGAYFFFASPDATLAPGDTNGRIDVFELNIATGAMQRLSLGTYGEQGSDESYLTHVSGDGRFVVWDSLAPEFVNGDTNSMNDVFVRERTNIAPPTATPTATATPTITPSPTATATPRIPPYPNQQFLPAVAFRKRLSTKALLNLTAIGNGDSYTPVTSLDGGVVAFTSAASNLVPNDTNNAADVFVWERATGQISRVSVSTDGAQLVAASERPALSEDGRYVVYTAWADGVVPQDGNGNADIYRYDRQTGSVVLVSVRADGGAGDGDSLHADVSADGMVVFFTSYARNLDMEVNPDVPAWATVGYIRKLALNTTTILDSNGTILQAVSSPSISDDGRRAALSAGVMTTVPCLGQPVGTYDVETGEVTTIAVLESNHRWDYLPYAPRISPDGTQVGYRFYASGQGPFPNGYFLKVEGATPYTLSRNNGGPIKYCDGPGTTPKISFSTSGTWVAFAATDLAGQSPGVPADMNGVEDVFLWDTLTHGVEWVSKPSDSSSNGHSYDPYMSGDGRTIVFTSEANNLAQGDSNGVADIYLWVAE